MRDTSPIRRQDAAALANLSRSAATRTETVSGPPPGAGSAVHTPRPRAEVQVPPRPLPSQRSAGADARAASDAPGAGPPWQFKPISRSKGSESWRGPGRKAALLGALVGNGRGVLTRLFACGARDVTLSDVAFGKRARARWGEDGFFYQGQLSVCLCPGASQANRKTLVRELVAKAAETTLSRPPGQELVLTDLAAGGLIQSGAHLDGLLAAGHKNLRLNVVDGIFEKEQCGLYRLSHGERGVAFRPASTPLGTRPDEVRAESKSPHANPLHNFLEYAHTQVHGPRRGVEVTLGVYQTPDALFDDIAHERAPAVDLMTLVDPSPALTTRDEAQANLLLGTDVAGGFALWLPSLGAPDVRQHMLREPGSSVLPSRDPLGRALSKVAPGASREEVRGAVEAHATGRLRYASDVTFAYEDMIASKHVSRSGAFVIAGELIHGSVPDDFSAAARRQMYALLRESSDG